MAMVMTRRSLPNNIHPASLQSPLELIVPSKVVVAAPVADMSLHICATLHAHVAHAM